MEDLRSRDEIGSSLDAEVELQCDANLYPRLAPLADELRFILINSDTRVLETAEASPSGSEIEGLTIVVKPSTQPKCIRCWQHRADVGAHPEHPEICGRCVENVAGAGEIRHYG
jgi:isoleucyl-tRNA synthetase